MDGCRAAGELRELQRRLPGQGATVLEVTGFVWKSSPVFVQRHIPSHYREIFSAEAVQTAVARLAVELTSWACQVEATHREPVLGVCVLRGGFVFFSDLLKAIPTSIQPAFVPCRSYSTEAISRPDGGVRIRWDEFNCAGRHVLLIDDICDSGRTLALLRGGMLADRAAEVRTCVLIHRARNDSVFTPDHFGFRHHGPEWFVGYGMDDCHRFMNYPAVYLTDPKG